MLGEQLGNAGSSGIFCALTFLGQLGAGGIALRLGPADLL